MAADRQYENVTNGRRELEHEYGDKVHISSHPVVLTELARLCSEECHQPQFNRIIRRVYRHLIREVVGECLPQITVDSETRMKSENPEGVYRGPIVEPDTPVITVDVARAGIIPSDVCFSFLSELLDSDGIRQDHLILSREVDEHSGEVGIDVCADKVGGTIQDNYVIFPDPMGATGTSIDTALSYYKEQMPGEAETLITANLMVTPEFVQNITDKHPDVHIFAARFDRGLSSKRALNSVPGKYPDEESGLNDRKYIVPGGGGFGELMNNAWD